MNRFAIRGLCLFITINILSVFIFCSTVWAEQKIYEFSSSGPYSIPAELSPYIVGDDALTGTFSYDSDVAVTGIIPINGPVNLVGGEYYNSSFSDLSGSFKGMSFSDPYGTTLAQNDSYGGGTSDMYLLNSSPFFAGLPHDFSGFSVGDYTIVSFRLWWREGQNSITDFLDNQELLAELPTEEGVLTLGFVHNDTYALGTWTFEEELKLFLMVSVTPVVEPEPAPATSTGVSILNGWWLLPAVGGGLVLLRRRSKKN